MTATKHKSLSKTEALSMTLRERFDYYAMPDPMSDCYLWCGAISSDGYGCTSVDGLSAYAHRLSWEIHYGPIPTGMIVCHKCDVRPCVNPDHLFLGTHADNVADKMAKGRMPNFCGEANGYAKLTDKDAMAIFLAHGRQRDIGARYGVGQQTVSFIKLKKTWRHIHVPLQATTDAEHEIEKVHGDQS